MFDVLRSLFKVQRSIPYSLSGSSNLQPSDWSFLDIWLTYNFVSDFNEIPIKRVEGTLVDIIPVLHSIKLGSEFSGGCDIVHY